MTTTDTCWVLTNADGVDLDQDGVPHFPTEATAAENASHLADDSFKPRQLDHHCIIVACTCCGLVYDEEDDGVAHFESHDEAESLLAGFWEFTGDGAKCDVCKVGPCDPEAGTHG